MESPEIELDPCGGGVWWGGTSVQHLFNNAWGTSATFQGTVLGTGDRTVNKNRQ